jgi:type I restriction enzyme S subunit
MTWETSALSEIAHIERDGVDASEIRSGTAYVGLEDIESGGRILRTTAVKNGDLASTKFRFGPQHILYGKLRPYLAKIALPDFSGICSTDILPIRPKSGTDRKFLAYYLRQPHMVEMATARAAGVNLPRISPRLLAEFEVPRPPLEEQRRIAAILDKADAIRRKREQSLALADDLLKSAFQHRYGDPATNPRKLRTEPIKGLGEVVTGNTPSRQSVENYGAGIEWIKSDNINTPSHFLTVASERLSATGERLARKVPAGSTLVTCIAGSPDCIGNAAMTDREVAFNQQINAIVPNKNTDPYFLYAQVLVAKKLIQRASTNSMKGMVSKGRFQEIEFLAPDEDEQRAFGVALQRMLGALDKIQRQAEEATHLFASLSQRAFRGEL